MAIRIGHASIDERGKATGGVSGDQTGKEVKISSWYRGGWGFLARARDASVAEKIAAACEAGCANPAIGYDQSGRNTLMLKARAVGFDLGKITEECEADCSSFVSVCVRAGLGKDFYTGNAPTTRTLKRVLKGTGAFDILEEGKYLTGSGYLRRGDILVNPGKHTVMVLGTGSNGKETPAVAQPATDAAQPVITYTTQLPILKQGSKGTSVKALQILLLGYDFSCGKYGADGDLGPDTRKGLKDFQAANKLDADGICGENTWNKLLGLG